MKQLSTLLSLFILMMFLSSCGSSDSESDCVMTTQKDMDRGNYAQVVERMQSDSACLSAYGEVDYYRNLSGAYFGLAGFEAIGVIGAIASYSDPAIDNAFKRFVSSFSFDVSNTTFQNVVESVNFNIAAIQGQQCVENFSQLNGQTQDTCLYLALTSIIESVTALWLAADGLQSWYDTAGDEEQLSAVCAIQYARTHGTKFDNVCSITESNITFIKNEHFVTLTQLHVDVNASTYFHLMDNETLEPVISFGNSTETLIPCPEADGISCFPEPVFYKEFASGNVIPLTYRSGILMPLNLGFTILKLTSDKTSQTYQGVENLMGSIGSEDANLTYDDLEKLLK